MTDSTTLGDGADARIPLIDKREDLEHWLGDTKNQGHLVHTRLKASGRVIARVTDGIYREPASALRELISNAWDADAANVTVLTDAPRFSRIFVRDDGAGMSYETLSRLVHSIGGSAKRQEAGQRLGISARNDPDRTPRGRALIGKIGIGLFSVSQLARSFRIITKMSGLNYRLTAEVNLRAYSDGTSEETEAEDDETYVTGDVYIVREGADDLEAHGTDIIIDEVKPLVRDLLRSANRWYDLEKKHQAEREGDLDTLATLRVETPKFHIGWMQQLRPVSEGPALLTIPAVLPWSDADPATERMSRMMDGIEQQFTYVERPDLETTLDNYLQTLWDLSLSVPVRYVEKHPFDLDGASEIRLFWISNESRGQAVEVPLAPHQTVREAVAEHAPLHPALEDGLQADAAAFRVVIDGFELRRPVRFKFIGATSRGLNRPMLFVGRYTPNLGGVDVAQRGGSLSFEAYLFWNGRVVPKENNGVLVRIRGASGALFDQTFFGYQISEQTRLRQISSEIFVRRGVDAALNIDRESFNYSHPHIVLLAGWLHRSIRQLTNQHKAISQRNLESRRENEIAGTRDALSSLTARVWAAQQGSEPLPDVTIADTLNAADRARNSGSIALVRGGIPSLIATLPKSTRSERDAKARALVRVLAAYGLLKDRPYSEQQQIIDAILQIFLVASGR